jgi:hypothetical protein
MHFVLLLSGQEDKINDLLSAASLSLSLNLQRLQLSQPPESVGQNL